MKFWLLIVLLVLSLIGAETVNTKFIDFELYTDFRKKYVIDIEHDELLRQLFYVDISHTYGKDYNVVLDRVQGIDNAGEYHEIKFRHYSDFDIYSINNQRRYTNIVLSGYIYKYETYENEQIFHKDIELKFKKSDPFLIIKICGIATTTWAFISQLVSYKIKRL